MANHHRWIDRYLKRIAFGQFLKKAEEWLAFFLIFFGLAVLMTKLMIPALWPHILWAGLLVIPLLVLAWKQVQDELFSRSESLAHLDRKLNAGGLLLTLYEQSEHEEDRSETHSEWSSQLPQKDSMWQNAIPSFRPVRMMKFLLLPLLFCLGAGFIPLRKIEPISARTNTVAQQATSKLEKMLDQLEDASVIEEKEAEELREEIENLKQEAERAPLTHEKWETVDALRERMLSRLNKARMTVSKAMAATTTLDQSHKGDLPELSVDKTENLTKDVAKALQQFGKDAAEFPELATLKKQVQQNAKQGKSKAGNLQLPEDAAEREKLMKDLEDFLKQESEKIDQLCKQCQGEGGNCEGDGNSEQGKEGEQQPGKGGRGSDEDNSPAPLVYGEESSEQETKFKSVILPKGYLDKPKDELVGQTASAPDVVPAETSNRNEKRDKTAASGHRSYKRQIRPTHRNVVERYFDSP